MLKNRPNLRIRITGVPLIVLAVCWLSCGNGLETRTETAEDGYRTEYQFSPETGKREGWARNYAPDGRLLSEENYAEGRLQGERRAFYPDGSLEIVEHYRDGTFHGDYLTYDSTGHLKVHGQYTDGVMSDTWLRYWPNGRVREEVAVADNADNGPFREWYEDGKPSAAGTYTTGKESGVLWQWDEQGNLLAIRDCGPEGCPARWKAESGEAPPLAPPDMTRPPDLERE